MTTKPKTSGEQDAMRGVGAGTKENLARDATRGKDVGRRDAERDATRGKSAGSRENTQRDAMRPAR